MKRFIREILLILIYFLIFSLILIFIYVLKEGIKKTHIPGPNLSNSISLNQKIKFQRMAGVEKLDVLSLGSSMTLNNLHSEVITTIFDTKSYLNLSAWGMNMEENYKFLKIYWKQYHPKTVIIVSNIMDFISIEKDIKYSKIREFIEASSLLSYLYHLNNFSISYYIDNIKYLKNIASRINTYESLIFDEYGAVLFSKDNFEILESRWNLKASDVDIDSKQYAYLDSIACFCNNNEIDLLFFQSPIRDGLYKSLNDSEINIVNSHINKITSILDSNNLVFINSLIRSWDDSLFVDSNHLSIIGSELFTEYCLLRIHP